MAKAKDVGCEIILPVDAVVADTLAPGVAVRTVPVNAVPAGQMMLDIGPKSVEQIIARLKSCRTLVWNGPLGAFETEPFDVATTAVARAVAELTRSNTLLSVAGGGDTMAALAKAGVDTSISYVSAAGGAFLEWLEGRKLPGVEALLNNQRTSKAV